MIWQCVGCGSVWASLCCAVRRCHNVTITCAPYTASLHTVVVNSHKSLCSSVVFLVCIMAC